MRDLIYFDVDKASSLISQLEGGLLREVQEQDGRSESGNLGLKASIQFLKAEIAAGDQATVSRVETRILHHDLLNRLEELLFDQGYATDVNEAIRESSSLAEIHELTANSQYVRAEGWAVIDDFERMKLLLDNFNAILEVIQQSHRFSLEQTEEYKSLRSQIEEQKAGADSERDKNRRHEMRQLAQKGEKLLQSTIESSISTVAGNRLPDWLVEGIKLWIKVFHGEQIHLRIFPNDAVPRFQLLANLKRKAFVEEQLDHVLFAYGRRPTTKLTVLGLVTSAPSDEGHPFDPMAEFAQESGIGSDTLAMERSFRNAFAGMEGLEAFGRFARFPVVTVYPIAVFRTMRPAGQ